MVEILPLQFGLPGGPEMLIILLIAVLLFGASKIPKLARSSGEAIGEFQKGREEVEQELQEIREGPSSGTDDSTESSSGVNTGAGDDDLVTEADTESGDDDLVSEAETEETT